MDWIDNPQLINFPELIPSEVHDILMEYSDGDFDYETCQSLEDALNVVGYTIDWGLDAEPYDLRPLDDNAYAELLNKMKALSASV